MKIKAILGKKRVLAGEGHDADVLVKLLAPVQPRAVQRPALAIVPIVDVSGSMAGSKLGAVQRALLCLLDHLVPGATAVGFAHRRWYANYTFCVEP